MEDALRMHRIARGVAPLALAVLALVPAPAGAQDASMDNVRIVTHHVAGGIYYLEAPCRAGLT